MSEGRTPTATLTRQWQPTPEEVNLLSEIIIHAQGHPLATDKDSLLTAYQHIFEKYGLNIDADNACIWFILQILSPKVHGETLYEKFETILEREGISVYFEDEPSVNESTQSPVKDAPRRLQVNQRTRSLSLGSHNPSIDKAYEPDRQSIQMELLDRNIDEPPSHIAQLMRVAESMDRRALVKQSFEAMRPIGLAANERIANNFYENKLKVKVLTHMRNESVERRSNLVQADDIYLRGRVFSALKKMLDAARINRLQAMEEERLRSLGLYKMTIATRETGFRRGLDSKLKSKYFKAMVDSFRTTTVRQTELESILQNVQQRSSLRALQPAIAKLISTSYQLRNMDQEATNHHSTSIATKSVHAWFGKAQATLEMQTTAEHARRIFLMRKYLFKMRDAARARRLRRTVLASWVLKRWRLYVRERKHDQYDAAYRAMRRKLKMNLARRCLDKMKQKASSIQEIAAIANERVESRSKAYTHGVVVMWYNNSDQYKQAEEAAVNHANELALKHTTTAMVDRKRQHDQLARVANQFQDLHVQGVAVVCLKTMGRKTFEIQRRRQDADAFRSRLDKQAARGRLDRWRRKAADSRGEGPLILPPATPAQRRADQLTRLASTTPSYPPRTPFLSRIREEGRQSQEQNDATDSS